MAFQPIMLGTPATWMRDLRGHRAGSVVLVSALLGTVFVASLGVGYTASRPLNDTGGAVLAKGNTVAYVNGESGELEAEARALATGKTDMATVALRDGRVAVVDNKGGQVWIIEAATMAPQGAPTAASRTPNCCAPRWPPATTGRPMR